MLYNRRRLIGFLRGGSTRFARDAGRSLAFDQAEVQFAAFEVDSGDGHPQRIAQPERVARATARKRVRGAVEVVVVVGQGVGRG